MPLPAWAPPAGAKDILELKRTAKDGDAVVLRGRIGGGPLLNSLGNVLGAFLKESKLEERVEAAQVVPEWESLVGKQIATVTKPISVTRDGTLFVSVKTNGWMTELSLMEPQLLRALNAKEGRTRIKKIRLQLMR